MKILARNSHLSAAALLLPYMVWVDPLVTVVPDFDFAHLTQPACCLSGRRHGSRQNGAGRVLWLCLVRRLAEV